MQPKKIIQTGLLLAALIAMLAGCRANDGLTLTADAKAPAERADASGTASVAETETETPDALPEPVKQISVHVCGAVKVPGVYDVPENARIIDAVQAAGGFVKDADTEAVNLAAFLVDGCRLRIPAVSETEGETQDGMPDVLTVGTNAQPADNLVVLADGISGQDGKINLNTASAEELCTLNGIGPKRASDIIRYREEHGSFSNIEEVMNVSGIGTTLFANIREYIRV